MFDASCELPCQRVAVGLCLCRSVVYCGFDAVPVSVCLSVPEKKKTVHPPAFVFISVFECLCVCWMSG